MQLMALCRRPAAAVLVHKGHGKGQSTSQSDAIAMAVFGLRGGVACIIQREPNDQSLNPTFVAELPDLSDIVVEVTTMQCVEWRDSQSKAVTACEPDPSTADIKAEC